MNLTDAELRIMRGIEPHGAVVDRYGRIVAGGKIIAHQGSSTPLRLVAKGLIEAGLGDEHLYLSPAGRAVLKERE
jgi:hypothetical protein